MRLDSLEHKYEEERSSNSRNLLEYAELGEKMRRLYLRIARRAKIEEEATSEPDNGEKGTARIITPEEIRIAIEKGMDPL